MSALRPAHSANGNLLHALTSRLSCLIDALLPASCALCGNDQQPHRNQISHNLCKQCCDQYCRSKHPRCPICARNLPHAKLAVPCGACISDPPAFDASIVVCDYAAPVDQLVQDLKFHAQLALAAVFAELLAGVMRQQGGIQDGLITGVPLSAARLAERGFNQSVEIARPLAAGLGLPFAPIICERVRDTAAQAGLSLKERHANMRHAFIVSASAPAVLNRHIIMVDDVMTSGHTLHALAACLKRYGAARVINLVFARTPLH